VYRYVGLLEEAEREQVRALELSPGNPRFRSLGVTYFYEGKYDSALKAFDLDPGTPWTWVWKTHVCRLMGRHDLEAALVESLQLHTDERMAQEPDVDGETIYSFAGRYAREGKIAECARALKKAVELGFFCYPYMARDPDLDRVRSDPGVQEALGLARQKHEEFKKKWSGTPP
jgi:tetratricopeptide (TPR) repeat protein